MSSKVLFLTGAPDSSSLDWEPANLLVDLTAPVARFAGVSCSGENVTSLPLTAPGSRQAAWRSLNLARQHLATGHSQIHGWVDGYLGNAAFFTTSDLSFASSDPSGGTSQPSGSQESSSESVKEVLSQFYEQSFALHETTASSQIPTLSSQQRGAGSDSDGESIFESNNETSFASSTPNVSLSYSSRAASRRLSIPDGGHICDLKDIPNVKYLGSIQPQTMTVNLVVGIITVSCPREIKTRRGGHIDIVELIVGDETKSGFGINFWLQPNSNISEGNGNADDMKIILGCLRPQDIVLLRNVAVSSFRGKVYGQSLRKGMTKVHLLYRNRVDRSDASGCYTVDDLGAGQDEHPQIVKTRRVKEWALRFVAPVNIWKASKGKIEIVKEILPPDTQ